MTKKNISTRDCMFRGKMIICDQYPCSRSCGWHPETEQRRKKKLRQKAEEQNDEDRNHQD